MYVALPEIQHRARTVADVLVETLVAFGVRHVFGMVGHSNLGFADALRRAEERGEITYIGIRHEGAAAFAASAYGKLTGRPAACLAIAGPGSTNLLTGLYDARLDQSPVIAISGQVPSKVLGRGAFQDLDLSAVFKDVAIVVGHPAGRQRPRRAGRAGRQARDRPARGGAPGAAGRGAGPAVASSPPRRPAGRLAGPAGNPPAADVGRRRGPAVRPPAARSSSSGTAPAAPATGCIALAERLGAPVLTTFKAKGLVPDTHPLGRRGARPQRHPGGELADERIGPDHRDRRVLLEPHRHRDLQADHPDRRQPRRHRAFRPGRHRPGR